MRAMLSRLGTGRIGGKALWFKSKLAAVQPGWTGTSFSLRRKLRVSCMSQASGICHAARNS
jgi:hypothetical protein